MLEKIEIAGAVVGLVYIWLEYRASVWLWVAGIVMPAIYVWVFWQEAVYANVAINAWFVVAAVWGLWMWKRDASSKEEPGKAAEKNNGEADEKRAEKTEPKERPVTRAPHCVWPPALAVGAVLWLAIYWVLTHFPGSTAPVWDAFTTAYSVVGLWMLARKWAEQWLVWIVVDGTYTAMFATQGMWPTSAMYGVFTVMAVLGYFKWKRMAL